MTTENPAKVAAPMAMPVGPATRTALIQHAAQSHAVGTTVTEQSTAHEDCYHS